MPGTKKRVSGEDPKTLQALGLEKRKDGTTGPIKREPSLQAEGAADDWRRQNAVKQAAKRNMGKPKPISLLEGPTFFAAPIPTKKPSVFEKIRSVLFGNASK